MTENLVNENLIQSKTWYIKHGILICTVDIYPIVESHHKRGEEWVVQRDVLKSFKP